MSNSVRHLTGCSKPLQTGIAREERERVMFIAQLILLLDIPSKRTPHVSLGVLMEEHAVDRTALTGFVRDDLEDEELSLLPERARMLCRKDAVAAYVQRMLCGTMTNRNGRYVHLGAFAESMNATWRDRLESSDRTFPWITLRPHRTGVPYRLVDPSQHDFTLSHASDPGVRYCDLRILLKR